jgi:hypothetical protein
MFSVNPRDYVCVRCCNCGIFGQLPQAITRDQVCVSIVAGEQVRKKDGCSKAGCFRCHSPRRKCRCAGRPSGNYASTAELPKTLTRPDRTIIQEQKTPVSTFGLTFYRPVLERFYRQGVGAPLSIQFFYSPMMERTSVQFFDCSIQPERLTGSSPLTDAAKRPAQIQDPDMQAVASGLQKQRPNPVQIL